MLLPWREQSIDGGPPILTSLTELEVSYLRSVAHGLVLEVGSAFGYSSIAMARSADVGHVIAVDPHGQPTDEDSLVTMRGNLAEYEVDDRVSIMLAPSQVALPQLFKLGARFDCIFVDGDHSAQAVEHDLRWAPRLLRRDHLVTLTGSGWSEAIAVHDVGEDTCPDVRPVALQMLGEPVELVDTLGIW